ncbi:RNA polymerase sigma factor [Bacteroidales bacterium OttesenSCG-928-A17]|nr:RNA polymerase sigma factor [Bacteroidales bacterium OttesenSCG-928-A17]
MATLTNFDALDNNGAFESWMRKISANTALKMIRKMQLFSWNDTEESEDTISTSNNYGWDVADVIAGYIAQLSAHLRVVLNMYIEGYSHSEIAQMLNIKESTSQSYFTQAKQILLTQLKKLSIA